MDGWSYPRPDLGNYGDDFVFRAAVATAGLGALDPAEAMYVWSAGDGRGLFAGDGLYRLSLPGPPEATNPVYFAVWRADGTLLKSSGLPPDNYIPDPEPGRPAFWFRGSNRELALATADVVQRRLGVDLGLGLGQPLPPLHSRQAAGVARRVFLWATQQEHAVARDHHRSDFLTPVALDS